MNREIAAERRQAPRVDARLPLQLTEPDTRLVVTTESLDLSRNGIACRTGEYLAPLSKVAVTVILPPFGNLSRASRSLRAEGVVVRCEAAAQPNGADGDREYDLACCFTALEPDARNLLDAFVAWRLLRSVRSEEPRPSASHGSGHGGSAARTTGGRFGSRPRGRGRPTGGPRHGSGGGYRDARGGHAGHGGREGARSERGYDPRRSRESGAGAPRGERGRPPRGRGSYGGGHAGPAGHSDTARPHGERRRSEGGGGYRERPQREGHGDRPHRGERGPREAREGRSSEPGRGGRPPRGRGRFSSGRPTEGRQGGREGGRQGGRERGGRPPRGRGRPGGSFKRSGPGEARSPEGRAPRDHQGHRAHEGERTERERPERGEGGGREERNPRWGRRPSRGRTSPPARRDDPESR